MNKKALLSRIGSPLRIRPIARRVFEAQHLELEQIDDLWYLRSPTRSDAVIALWNARTPHVIELGADNIQEFRSPDFLLLKAQLIMTERTLYLEPLPDWRAQFWLADQA